MGKPQSTGNLVNALAQDSSNNIGIGGAANASFKLQVTGATNLTGALSGTSARFASDVELNGGTGTRTLTVQSNTSGDAILQLLAAGSNGGSIKYSRSTNEIIFNNNAVDAFKIAGSGAATFANIITATSGTFTKSSNSGSGSVFPRLQIENTLPTQGDGSSTFNFADIRIASGNGVVTAFLGTTYAAGTWAPAAFLNVSTNHDLQIKTNNTTRLTIANSGAATFLSSVNAEGDVNVRSASSLRIYRSDNTRYLTLFTDNNGCYVDANQATSEPLALQSNGTSGRVVINTAGTERLRVSSAGNVGVGLSGSNLVTTFQVRNNHWQQYIQKSFTSQTNFISVNLKNNGAAIINVTSSAFRPGVDTYAQTIQYFVVCKGEVLTVNTANNLGGGIVLNSVSGSTITLAFGYAGGGTNFQNAYVSIQGVSQNGFEESIVVTLL